MPAYGKAKLKANFDKVGVRSVFFKRGKKIWIDRFDT